MLSEERTSHSFRLLKFFPSVQFQIAHILWISNILLLVLKYIETVLAWFFRFLCNSWSNALIFHILQLITACRYDTKPRNARKCMEVSYIYLIFPTCFVYACAHLQGGTAQRIYTSKYYKCFWPNAQISNIKH